ASEPEGNAPVETVRETIERAVSDVNRILGLQGLPADDAGGVAQAGLGGGSTLSIGCSTASWVCGGGGGTRTVQR
ncbi:hypothetical protein, partial [Streptomyces pharetrae]